MRRLKYLETSTMKVVLCDCHHTTGFDNCLLTKIKSLPKCANCGRVLYIKRYFKKLMVLCKD